jgi:hypothetical protein
MALTKVGSGVLNIDDLYGFRNRIINGGMVIDQRNAGAAVTTNAAFPVDRFSVGNTSDGAFSAQQDSSAPAGFVNSVKITTTTADATLTTTQALSFVQRIEGTNIADLGWGSASAKTITISFWVRSSLTGTFGGALRNSAANRSYPFEYSISSADTWEQKSVTISGDTSGTWLTTNGLGINVFFGLGVGPDRSGTAGAWNSNNNLSATGAVSVIGTLNATWYITGVQLEVGSVATPFERRPFGTELALCQRYLPAYKASAANELICYAQAANSTTYRAVIPFQVTPRVKPTGITVSANGDFYVNGNANVTPTAMIFNDGSLVAGIVLITGSGMTAGYSCVLYSNTANAQVLFTGCEL